MELMRTGNFYGTAATLNVELGWVPDFVRIANITDGDVVIEASPSIKYMPFTSGGVAEIKAGMWVVGATSQARSRVRRVLLASGTWAGGDAAGTLVLDADTITGAFGSENVYFDGSSTINDATVTAAVNVGTKTTTAVASSTAVSCYSGVAAGAAKGFTLASSESESGKVFNFVAYRNLA